MEDRHEEERSGRSSDATANEQGARKRGKGRSRIEWEVDVIYGPEDEDRIAEEILVVLTEILSGRPVRYIRKGADTKRAERQAKGGKTNEM